MTALSVPDLSKPSGTSKKRRKTNISETDLFRKTEKFNDDFNLSVFLFFTEPKNTKQYAQTILLVHLILVKIFDFLVITRDHGSFEGRHEVEKFSYRPPGPF